MYSCNDPICDPVCDFCWFCKHDGDGVPVSCEKENDEEFSDGAGYCENFLCLLHEKPVLSGIELGLHSHCMGKFITVTYKDGQKSSGILFEWEDVYENIPGGEWIVLELYDGTYLDVAISDVASILVYPLV